MFETLQNWLRELLSQTENKNSRAHILIRGDRLAKGGYSVELEKKIYNLGIFGWMRPSETFIEFDLEAPKEKLDAFLTAIKIVPTWTRVDRVELAWNTEKKGYQNFRVRN